MGYGVKYRRLALFEEPEAAEVVVGPASEGHDSVEGFRWQGGAGLMIRHGDRAVVLGVDSVAAGGAIPVPPFALEGGDELTYCDRPERRRHAALTVTLTNGSSVAFTFGVIGKPRAIRLSM